MKNVTNTMKKRKGFSLVELVIVILIIAVLATAVFAGGSAIVKKSQVSRTESDLHNFSVAIEAAMNETPAVANIKNNGTDGTNAHDLKVIIDAVNENLSDDYKFNTSKAFKSDDDTSNLKFQAGSSYVILESAKTDAWGNNYYGIFDYGERHCKGQSDFFVTVVSAGPNAQTVVGGAIESDDIFLLTQYSDGDVVAATYDVSTKNDAEKMKVTVLAAADAVEFNVVAFDKTTSAKTVTVKGTPGSMRYAGGGDNTAYTDSVLPVNF